jgi:hypothetical protein
MVAPMVHRQWLQIVLHEASVDAAGKFIKLWKVFSGSERIIRKTIKQNLAISWYWGNPAAKRSHAENPWFYATGVEQ